jgi:hypothetical protein
VSVSGSKKHPFRTFVIRVDRRVIGVEDLESGVGFLKKTFDAVFYTKDDFFTKNIVFYKG